MVENVFRDAVNRVSRPTFMSQKNDIVEYLKDTYGSRWTARGAELFSGTSDTKSKAYKNAQRNFQGGREYTTPRTAAAKEKWAGIGQQLPPVGRELRKDPIMITVKGEQNNGRGGIRERNITVTLSGSTAYEWVNNPGWDPIWDEYGVDLTDVGDGEYMLENVQVSAA